MGDSAFIFTNFGDPATLEALAIRKRLALAEDLNQNRIHVASDSCVIGLQGVVKEVHNEVVLHMEQSSRRLSYNFLLLFHVI